MSEQPTTPLPELRPVRLQGKAYYTALRAILKEIKYDLKRDAERLQRGAGKFTVAHLCRLALTYRLNLKATAECLEDEHFLPAGTYQRLIDRGLRPMTALREVWAEMQNEEPVAPWKRELQKAGEL